MQTIPKIILSDYSEFLTLSGISCHHLCVISYLTFCLFGSSIDRICSESKAIVQCFSNGVPRNLRVPAIRVPASARYPMVSRDPRCAVKN